MARSWRWLAAHPNTPLRSGESFELPSLNTKLAVNELYVNAGLGALT